MDIYIDNKTAQQMVDPERVFQPVTSKCVLCGTEWSGFVYEDDCPKCKGLADKIVSYRKQMGMVSL